MNRNRTDFLFSVCVMGASLLIAIACADKARELDELKFREAELERSVAVIRSDIEELQAYCLEAKEAEELEDVK